MPLFSSSGAEKLGGSALPPVAPEVIHILLLQRSNRLPDAPAEHVIGSEVSGIGFFL